MTGAVTVGIVGVGTIAETHLAVLAEIPEVALSFVADPDPATSVSFKGTRPPRYDDVLQALGEHQPDLVVITTPTDTHAGLTQQVLAESTARVLVEKPLVHDLHSLDLLRSLADHLGLEARVSVAHHFAFSPEVRWAADQMAQHPEWGPVTQLTSVFHDPYIADAEHSFAAYVSSWVDSGVNQLSLLAHLVELVGRGPLHETDGGASSWCDVAFRSRGATATALLRASWQAAGSSKRTTLTFGRSGTEMWLDHTAVTAVVIREGALVDSLTNDGGTPRKIAHYRPLYRSLLSEAPDRLLSFDAAAAIVELLHGDRHDR